jgi:peptidoglycan hydrolase-like protein with peptidoglycan-binding domain/TPR repeat protein
VSRSAWAWTRSCALVSAAARGAGRLGTHEVQACLGDEQIARTASSLTPLSRVATALMLTLACCPATALGKVGSRNSRAPAALAIRGASGKHGVTRATSRNSHPTPARRVSGPDPNSRPQPLTPGSGYSNTNGSSAVRALQRRLVGLGYSPGPVDGRYGPLTEAAVIRFQAAHGLQVDGVAGRPTLAALASAKPVLYPGEGYAGSGSGPVRRLQRELAIAGYAPGPIDGRYGPLTERAVMRFQADRRLTVDGIAGPQTLGRLQTALVRVRRPTTRVPSRPGAVHRRARPATPRSAGVPGRTPVTSPKVHRATRPAASLPIVWIAVLAGLLVALLTAAVWRLRPRRKHRLVPSEERPTRERESPDAGTGVESPEDLPGLTLPAPEVPGRAAEQVVGGTEAHNENRPLSAEAYGLGVQLAQDRELVAAEDAFRQADEAGHPEAAFELGVLLERKGDRAGAKDAFRRADERGHAGAAFDLAALLLQEEDHMGAEAWFGRADQQGDPAAASNLGVLLEQRGDRDGAKDAYRRADERGDGVGACNLGAMLEQEGDLAQARAAYRRADERGDSVGAYSLGVLLERGGDRAGAKDAFRRADQRGHPAAACTLGLLLKQEGDRSGALQALRRAGQHGSEEVSAVAHAALLELGGDEEGDR